MITPFFCKIKKTGGKINDLPSAYLLTCIIIHPTVASIYVCHIAVFSSLWLTFRPVLQG